MRIVFLFILTVSVESRFMVVCHSMLFASLGQAFCFVHKTLKIEKY